MKIPVTLRISPWKGWRIFHDHRTRVKYLYLGTMLVGRIWQIQYTIRPLSDDGRSVTLVFGNPTGRRSYADLKSALHDLKLRLE